MDKKKTAIVYVIIAVFFLLDRALKYLFTADWRSADLPLIGDALHLRLAQNPDMAFSLPLPLWLICIISSAILLLLIVIAVKMKKAGRVLEYVCWLAIISGAVSNLYDRFMFGYVVDYVDFMGISILNVADIMITCGAAGLFLILIKKSNKVS